MEGFTLTYTKTCCKALVIKSVSYCGRGKKNRSRQRKIPTHRYKPDLLLYYAINGSGTTGYPNGKKIILDPTSQHTQMSVSEGLKT